MEPLAFRTHNAGRGVLPYLQLPTISQKTSEILRPDLCSPPITAKAGGRVQGRLFHFDHSNLGYDTNI